MPETDKKDGKLDGNGMLQDMGVVMKDVMIVDEFHKMVELNISDKMCSFF